MFYFDKINGKKILKSSIIDGLNHFFTTRETVLKTKEPSFEDIVAQNRKDICEYFNITDDNLICPSQTHTSNVDLAQVEKTSYPDTDALILTNKVQAVYLNFADCTPLIFYDKVQNIAASSHAGWRGTAKKIAVKTVQKMCKDFGSRPENILCAIGPAISMCCYNVGKDVFEELMTTVKVSSGLYQLKNDEIYVDLKAINKRQLEEIGVAEIDVCPYCTVCNNDLFFSYRKENGTTNRHSAVIKL